MYISIQYGAVEVELRKAESHAECVRYNHWTHLFQRAKAISNLHCVVRSRCCVRNIFRRTLQKGTAHVQNASLNSLNHLNSTVLNAQTAIMRMEESTQLEDWHELVRKFEMAF